MSTNTLPLSKVFGECFVATDPIALNGPQYNFALTFNENTNRVSGVVEITQMLELPVNPIWVDVTGTYFTFLIMDVPYTMIDLSGTYAVACKPPADCILTKDFTAKLSLDADFNGSGVIQNGSLQYQHVTVAKTLLCPLRPANK